VKAATLRVEASFFRRLLSIAGELGEELAQPALRLPPVNNKRDRVLLLHEQAALKRIMCPWDFSIVEFVLNTGLRRLEVFRAERGHVQLFDRGGQKLGMLRVPQSKTGAARSVPLNSVAANIARVWMASRSSCWLFGRPRPNRFQEGSWFVRYVFRPALSLAEIRGLTFHGLRHTFATRALQGGARLEQISWALGHKTIEETRSRYAHWDEDQVWPAVLAVSCGGK
jgi:integrase